MIIFWAKIWAKNAGGILGNVTEYTEDEKGGYFTIEFLGDEELMTCPLDTFIGKLRGYYFDPTIDGFTHELWWYLNEQIVEYDSKLKKLDEDIKNFGICLDLNGSRFGCITMPCIMP